MPWKHYGDGSLKELTLFPNLLGCGYVYSQNMILREDFKMHVYIMSKHNTD